MTLFLETNTIFIGPGYDLSVSGEFLTIPSESSVECYHLYHIEFIRRGAHGRGSRRRPNAIGWPGDGSTTNGILLYEDQGLQV